MSEQWRSVLRVQDSDNKDFTSAVFKGLAPSDRGLDHRIGHKFN